MAEYAFIRCLADDLGQDLVEYALLLTFVALVCIVATQRWVMKPTPRTMTWRIPSNPADAPEDPGDPSGPSQPGRRKRPKKPKPNLL